MDCYLSFDEIVDLIENYKPSLVQGLSKTQIIPADKGGFAEGPCVELRIGRVFKSNPELIPILNYDFLDMNSKVAVSRYSPEVDITLDYQKDGLGREFTLERNQSVLVETIESINLPNSRTLSLVGKITPRFSLARIGISLLHSDADPGYHGKVIFRLHNIGAYNKISLGLGTRIVKLRFINIPGDNPQYIGRFGGVPGGFSED